MADPVFSVGADGITVPAYSEVRDYFVEKAKSIFGSDIDLSADTQDGQLLSIVALALHDVNSAAAGVYNAYNPGTAIGIALDSAVKVNGLTRRTATHSQADVTLVGSVGTVITDGICRDGFGRSWILPPAVVIPVSGEITVTATAETLGALEAEPGNISVIGTPVYGWHSVTNRTAATPGVAVETDAELREQQSHSTSLPSVSLWEGILSSVGSLPGVVSVAGVKNDTGETDENGIPPHSIAVIAEGGDVDEIAKTIFQKKSEGVSTYGDVEAVYTDVFGCLNEVRFSRPERVMLAVTLTIRPGETYTAQDGEETAARIASYINNLEVGEKAGIARALAAALKDDHGGIETSYEVLEITMGKKGSPQSAASVEVAWNEVAKIELEDVLIVTRE